MRTAIVAAVVILSILGAGPASSRTAGEKPAVAAPAGRIEVTFKLDPRLSGPTYGGERWISPKTYSGITAQDAVEARAFRVDAKGRSKKIDASWSPSDPGMVTVSPPRGEQVRISATRAGQSTVTVTHGGASKQLTVKAFETNGVLRIEILQ